VLPLCKSGSTFSSGEEGNVVGEKEGLPRDSRVGPKSKKLSVLLGVSLLTPREKEASGIATLAPPTDRLFFQRRTSHGPEGGERQLRDKNSNLGLQRREEAVKPHLPRRRNLGTRGQKGPPYLRRGSSGRGKSKARISLRKKKVGTSPEGGKKKNSVSPGEAAFLRGEECSAVCRRDFLQRLLRRNTLGPTHGKESTLFGGSR